MYPRTQESAALDQRLERIAESVLERMGYELIDFERAGHRGRPILRLRVDRQAAVPGSGITVDECASVSRALEEVLDRRDDLPASYILEVSSPGIERPLRKARDYERHVGRQIAIRGYEPLIGKAKRIEGTLLAVEGEGEERRLRLRLSDETQIEVATSAVAKANLVFRWEDEESERAKSR